MTKITIKETQNPAIVKFEFPDFIVQNESFEFKNIDEAKLSPLAQQLFYLPFVKTVYISGNFIAIERYTIVEWDDVQDDVAEQIVRIRRLLTRGLGVGRDEGGERQHERSGGRGEKFQSHARSLQTNVTLIWRWITSG